MVAGVITALRLQRRKNNRVSVFIDGHYQFGVQKIIAAGLKVGEELSEADIERLKNDDEEQRAYERALRYLSRRPHSEKEIANKLSRNRIEISVQDRVLKRLREASLVDDGAFARVWVENRQIFRPRSGRMLRSELRGKGVSKEAIETALEGFDEAEAALTVARKARKRYRDLSEEASNRRLRQFLARRGFSYELISSTLSILMHDGSGSDEESEVDK
ncbi:MAG: RecX family transcriptional regulator [Anaerolineales bacterium]|jgi:regulatory protein|nr:RecX family transcriptional regulator [Anaerolineales bacterium]